MCRSSIDAQWTEKKKLVKLFAIENSNWKWNHYNWNWISKSKTKSNCDYSYSQTCCERERTAHPMNFAISTKIDNHKYLRENKCLTLWERDVMINIDSRFDQFQGIEADSKKVNIKDFAPLGCINWWFMICMQMRWRNASSYWNSSKKYINLIRSKFKGHTELTSCWFQSWVYYLYLTLKANRICYHHRTSISPFSKNKYHIEKATTIQWLGVASVSKFAEFAQHSTLGHEKITRCLN